MLEESIWLLEMVFSCELLWCISYVHISHLFTGSGTHCLSGGKEVSKTLITLGLIQGPIELKICFLTENTTIQIFIQFLTFLLFYWGTPTDPEPAFSVFFCLSYINSADNIAGEPFIKGSKYPSQHIYSFIWLLGYESH